jgi:uncharacterized protein (TIGR02246 family)
MTLGRIGRVWVISAWICGWLFATSAAGRQGPPSVPASDEVEHEALRQLRPLYESAIRDNKLDALAPLLADDFYGVMVTGRAVTGIDGLKRYWADIHALMGEGGQYTTTLTPERSVLIGDVALARGTSADVVTTSEGQEFRFTSMWTAVLQKQDGRWRLRQAQGTIDPVDNPFVREFARRSLRWAVVLSGGVGILVGALLGWLFGRRRHATA